MDQLLSVVVIADVVRLAVIDHKNRGGVGILVLFWWRDDRLMVCTCRIGMNRVGNSVQCGHAQTQGEYKAQHA